MSIFRKRLPFTLYRGWRMSGCSDVLHELVFVSSAPGGRPSTTKSKQTVKCNIYIGIGDRKCHPTLCVYSVEGSSLIESFLADQSLQKGMLSFVTCPCHVPISALQNTNPLNVQSGLQGLLLLFTRCLCMFILIKGPIKIIPKRVGGPFSMRLLF